MTITREDFERAYAERSGVTVSWLRASRAVRPCTCGDDSCEGWQSLSFEAAAEYDKQCVPPAHRLFMSRRHT